MTANQELFSREKRGQTTAAGLLKLPSVLRKPLLKVKATPGGPP